MLLPWGDEQLATQRGEIRGRGRGGERRPNYTRYRPTSKEPTVPLLSEPSPPNGRPENNAPLPRIPQSSGGRRRPDYAFDTLFLLSSLFSSSFPFLPIFCSTRILLVLFDRGITRGGRTRFVRKHYRYIIRLSHAFVAADAYSWNSEYYYLCLTVDKMRNCQNIFSNCTYINNT